MAKDDKEIVSRVHQALLDRVGSERFDLWFGERVEFGWRENQLLVFAPDLFTLDRLRNKLRSDIEAACQTATGSSDVHFQLSATSPDGAPRGNSVAPVSLAARGSMRSSPVTRAGAPSAVTLRARESAAPARSPATATAPRSLATRAPVTWSQFVVGDGNRLAFTAAQSTVRQLGAVTPLYLHGPSGCGKSHLAECILHDVRRRTPGQRALMLSAEQFTSQFLEALHGAGLPSFRRKYRDVDLLILDDVHFFAGKKATMVELQYTVDTLQRAGRQLVLTADRPPHEVPGLGRELVNRLCGGLVCRLEAADVAVRLGILEQQCERRGLRVPRNVLELLASQLTGDARVLSGSLFRLQATSQALHRPITVELAQSALADLFRATRRVIRLPDIEQAVCQVFGLDSRCLQSDAKKRAVSQPRMLAMWLARKYTRSALSEIGEFFGRRSHTSVIAAQRKVDQLLNERDAGTTVQTLDCSFSEAVRRVELQLRTGT
ncbi:MAG: DnaA/Hda family protein [Pirellulales bacterium]